MTRTEAPKDLVGRGEVNLARTTPELPTPRKKTESVNAISQKGFSEHTVRPGDLAPDHADLGAPNLLLASVNVGDLLALVETVVQRVSRDALSGHGIGYI